MPSEPLFSYLHVRPVTGLSWGWEETKTAMKSTVLAPGSVSWTVAMAIHLSARFLHDPSAEGRHPGQGEAMELDGRVQCRDWKNSHVSTERRRVRDQGLRKRQVGGQVEAMRKPTRGASLVIQWLRLGTSKAGGSGSNPGQGTKIPHASWPKNKTQEKES